MLVGLPFYVGVCLSVSLSLSLSVSLSLCLSVAVSLSFFHYVFLSFCLAVVFLSVICLSVSSVSLSLLLLCLSLCMFVVRGLLVSFSSLCVLTLLLLPFAHVTADSLTALGELWWRTLDLPATPPPRR